MGEIDGGDGMRSVEVEKRVTDCYTPTTYADDNTTRERVQWTSRVRDARRMCVLLHNKVQCCAVPCSAVQCSQVLYSAVRASRECRNCRNCLGATLTATLGATCCSPLPALHCPLLMRCWWCVLTWIVLGLSLVYSRIWMVVDGYQGNLHFPCHRGSIVSIGAHN
jgi:hypothetical protein